MIRLLLGCLVLVVPIQASVAVPVTVDNLRVWRAPDHTRVVFDLSGKVKHTIFTLHQPERLVLDLDNAQLRTPLSSESYHGKKIRQVRSGQPRPGVLRLVLDLNQAVDPRSFVLTPNNIYGHRLVIDLYDHPTAISPGSQPSSHTPTAPPPATSRPPIRPPVIVIDAGHGGEDPGAIGKRRTREKNITLKIARELKKLD